MNQRMSRNAQWQAAIFRKEGLLPRTSNRFDCDDRLGRTGTDLLVHAFQGDPTRKDDPLHPSILCRPALSN